MACSRGWCSALRSVGPLRSTVLAITSPWQRALGNASLMTTQSLEICMSGYCSVYLQARDSASMTVHAVTRTCNASCYLGQFICDSKFDTQEYSIWIRPCCNRVQQCLQDDRERDRETDRETDRQAGKQGRQNANGSSLNLSTSLLTSKLSKKTQGNLSR